MLTDTHMIWGLDYRLLYIPVSIITNYWYVLYGLFFLATRKNTSVALGKHFDKFLADQIEAGRYGSTSEALRAGLHLLEEREAKLQVLLKNKDQT